jgi:hypothetical protein
MEQFKKVKVLMLPISRKEGHLELYRNKLNRQYKLVPRGIPFSKVCELYFLSDDEIKEDDWIKFHVKPIDKEWIHQVTKQDLIDYPNINNEGNKIIATTDTSLTVEKWSQTNKKSKSYNIQQNIETTKLVKFPLPQPHQKFIEKYIQCYNNGNIITDVLVEYETLKTTANNKHFGEGHVYAITNKLKVNPKDNTITIKKLKDSWNREEVINLCKIIFSCGQLSSKNNNSFEFNKWIKQNL